MNVEQILIVVALICAACLWLVWTIASAFLGGYARVIIRKVLERLHRPRAEVATEHGGLHSSNSVLPLRKPREGD